jgi:hypothetical protein
VISFAETRCRNGNKRLMVRRHGFRSFSIQTLGNLPETHRNGIGPWTLGEVVGHVEALGTRREMEMVTP